MLSALLHMVVGECYCEEPNHKPQIGGAKNVTKQQEQKEQKEQQQQTGELKNPMLAELDVQGIFNVRVVFSRCHRRGLSSIDS